MLIKYCSNEKVWHVTICTPGGVKVAYYVVLWGKTGAEDFDTLAEARSFAREKANQTRKTVEIDRVRTINGQFAGQSPHSKVKPSTRSGGAGYDPLGLGKPPNIRDPFGL